jgi:tetratricopeptide (TPR) repeat protein
MRNFFPAPTRWLIVLPLAFSIQAAAHPDPLENIKIYTYILSVSPDNSYAYLNRGISYRMVFDFQNAMEDFQKAEELGVTGRYLWMNRAMTNVSLKNFDEAIKDIDAILEEDPEDASSWFYRGEIHFHKKDFEKAISDYTKSLEVKETAHVRFVRGDAYRTLGDYEKALEDYTSAVEKRPYTVGFFIARARCLSLMGRLEEARADLDEAARKQPERYQVYIERAVLSASQSLEASKEADIEKALRYLDDEFFFRPKDSSLHADRARVYELASRFEEAEEDLNYAVQYAEYTDPKYLRLRAEFLERRGRKEAAESDRELAREVEARPMPTATPLPGPTLTLEELTLQPTPNLLPGLAR